MYPKLTNIYWLVLSPERATPWSRCAPVPAMYKAGSIPKIKPSGYLLRLLTKFPGRKIEGSGDGCIAYHFIWDFRGFYKLVKLQPVPITWSYDMALKKVKIHLLHFGAKPVVHKHGYRHFSRRVRPAACPRVVLMWGAHTSTYSRSGMNYPLM